MHVCVHTEKDVVLSLILLDILFTLVPNRLNLISFFSFFILFVLLNNWPPSVCWP